MSPTKNTQRLFFALWPDDKTRKAISISVKRAAQYHQGKSIHINNLHLTLAFLGNVNQAQREYLEQCVESISVQPFSLYLNHLGVFPRPKVLWLGIKEQPDALTHLVTSIEKCACDCGIKLDNKYFYPHVTLMRKVKQLNEFDIDPVHWDVNKFCLVESVSQPKGVEYKVVKSW